VRKYGSLHAALPFYAQFTFGRQEAVLVGRRQFSR